MPARLPPSWPFTRGSHLPVTAAAHPFMTPEHLLGAQPEAPVCVASWGARGLPSFNWSLPWVL